MTDDPDMDRRVADSVRGMIAEGELWEFRLLMFREHALNVGGQIGILMRSVLAAYDSFQEAMLLAGTTAGEETRLFSIVDEAMVLVESLRDGGQP
jgi:hypothetical protein